MDKNSIYVKNSVDNLRDYAKNHGLRLVFRNTPTNTGDYPRDLRSLKST